MKTRIIMSTPVVRLTIICITLNIIVASLIFFLSPASFTGNDDKTETKKLSQEILQPQLQNKHVYVSFKEKFRQLYSDNSSHVKNNPLDKLMPQHLLHLTSQLPVTMTAEEFRSDPSLMTGNPLMDTYGQNDVMLSGEMGRGLVLVGKEKEMAESWQKDLNLNSLVSDIVPLNRMVPDSRLPGCDTLTYPTFDLTVSVIVPFHNEWPSVLLRSVYSVINRSPRCYLQEIILVDDCSDQVVLGHPLQDYIVRHFPRDLVRLVRMPSRGGLIRARMAGFGVSEGDVVIFLDSHMEVNEDWLPPLLAQISADHKTVAMSVLDYIDATSLQYKFHADYFVRYGFDWRLFFFEVMGNKQSSTSFEPITGPVMVGSAFAVDRSYFQELGGYDVGMEIWGGENIEMSWRVWLCGGRLVHVPCSHVGHIARAQPYKFPDGKHETKLRNYKRAAEIWMGSYKKFLYENYPELKTMDAGDLSEREGIRDRLQCPHDFTWYLQHVWQQLTVYDENVQAWGSAINKQSGRCLDNRLFNGPLGLHIDTCHFRLITQGFSLTEEGQLRTTIHCVVVPHKRQKPTLRDCGADVCDIWAYTQDGLLVHEKSGQCLGENKEGPVMVTCDVTSTSQQWRFTNKAPHL